MQLRVHTNLCARSLKWSPTFADQAMYQFTRCPTNKAPPIKIKTVWNTNTYLGFCIWVMYNILTTLDLYGFIWNRGPFGRSSTTVLKSMSRNSSNFSFEILLSEWEIPLLRLSTKESLQILQMYCFGGFRYSWKKTYLIAALSKSSLRSTSISVRRFDTRSFGGTAELEKE